MYREGVREENERTKERKRREKEAWSPQSEMGEGWSEEEVQS